MSFLRKYFFLFIGCVYILSCADRFGDQRNNTPKNSTSPKVKPSSKKSSDEDDQQDNFQAPLKQKVKKKKNTAIDTLKPIKVLP